jgi:cell wall-associated NlpC family hydrolase
VGALAVFAGLLVAIPSGSGQAATPPPNPTDRQLHGAAQQKAAVAAEVGQLSAKVASMQVQLQQLKAAQEMAEQKLAYALSKLTKAKAAAKKAQAKVVTAQQGVNSAQRQFEEYVSATYMNGQVGGTTGALLTAQDPSSLLQQSALNGYESSHQLTAIGQMQTATVAKSNAEAAARRAVAAQAKATHAAKAAKQNADAAVMSARAQQKQLQTSLAQSRSQLQAAQLHLADLQHQRAAFIQYQKHQAALRRAAALAKKRAEAKARALAARLKREQERQKERESHHPGGGGSSTPPAPSGGTWTLQAGKNAVLRAEAYIGWMYAWAGGNANGPTYGVCAGDGAFNDCHVKGFDCSGLSLYAWAPSITLDHYAATQYFQAGSQHPSVSDLQPGDLVFWSSNGAASGIHHVAIYIGGGDVIQAPESGERIEITPLDDVDWGYFGATRPLT